MLLMLWTLYQAKQRNLIHVGLTNFDFAIIQTEAELSLPLGLRVSLKIGTNVAISWDWWPGRKSPKPGIS